MQFNRTSLEGAYLIGMRRLEDERGFFARSWCRRDFEARGLNAQLVQCNVSFNTSRGTLRGMHYQANPNQEVKLVRCTAGAIYDVLVDLRPASLSYGKWQAFELTGTNHLALYIPKGVAHGFQTTEKNTEVFYQMSEYYAPESVRGVRWNDPAFAIDWPIADPILSLKDQQYPDFAG